MSIQLHRFTIDVSVDTEKFPETFTACDELHDAIAGATVPEWFYSIDLVEPGPDHAPNVGSDS